MKWVIYLGTKIHKKSSSRFFPVTFLGVLSDPFRGESWPLTRVIKVGHELNHLDQQIQITKAK